MEVPQKENEDASHPEASENPNTTQGGKPERVASLSGHEQERESQMSADVSPRTQRRLRKMNPRFSDYEMDKKPSNQSPKQKRRGRPPKKSSADKESPQAMKCQREKEMEPLEESDPDTRLRDSRENTPKGKKTPARKTPAKKTRRKDNSEAAEAEDAVAAQQTSETPKPKRKYVKRQVAEQDVGPALQEETPPTAEEEISPCGRPRRSAAKTWLRLRVSQRQGQHAGAVETALLLRALKYLQSLAQENLNSPDESDFFPGYHSGRPNSLSDRPQKRCTGGKGVRSRKKKRSDDDSDNAAQDEDFVPDAEDLAVEEDYMEEEEEEEEDLESELEPANQFYIKGGQSHRKVYGDAANGLPNAVMRPAVDAYVANKTFREEHYSSWVFPEWVPSVKDWHAVPRSEVEKYLPGELQSAAFKVSREGLGGEEAELQRLNRLESTEPHPERLDMTIFVGGPVWALEWCPSPDGASANQYLALACHQGMEDQHLMNQTYSGHSLVQLWDLGQMEYGVRPGSRPSLAYGLGQDKGFIWQLRWCPAGAWELPSCSRKAPFLPRLGLLAVATSTGVVTIYSLPHPEALRGSNNLPPEEDNQGPLVYRAKEVLTLQLGSFRAPHHDKSGQVLCMDWLPDKPHNVMAIGFYDGMVGLWDLCSTSSLLRVRNPAHGMTLLPYRCYLAHDNAVRALCFCPASRDLLATAGNDRMVKMWDLKRLYQPITICRRNLTTEMYWPLKGPGTIQAQETTYAARGLHGVHYYDLGYRNTRPLFVTPRTGTVWSLSFSDWCNGLLTSDSMGEVIFALLPELNCAHHSVRRTVERRFPVYFTDMVLYNSDTNKEEHIEEEGQQSQEMETVAEEDEGGEKRSAGEGETSSGQSPSNEQAEAEHVSISDVSQPTHVGRSEEPITTSDNSFSQKPQTYQEAAKKYYLHYSDNDMQSFKNYQKRLPWKRMQKSELKCDLDLDIMPMAALHKVRFNPNMSCHPWVASAGQAGLVRVHCLQNMTSLQVKKKVQASQTQFGSLYAPDGGCTKAGDSPTVG